MEQHSARTTVSQCTHYSSKVHALQ